jgi:hypothetical protein
MECRGMREKFVIYQRPTKPRAVQLSTFKKFAAVCVLGMVGIIGLRMLYGPADSAASAGQRGDQSQQASDAPKQVLALMAAPTSVAPVANPSTIVTDDALKGSITQSELRADVPAAPQSPENATPNEQRPEKAEKTSSPKPVSSKPKVARHRNGENGAYAQSTYQDPYRANAGRWAWSAQRQSGFFPF